MIGKTCTKCHVWKLLREFHKNQGGIHDRASQCKACKAEYDHCYRRAYPDKVSAASQRWRKKNRRADMARQRRWRKKHPEKTTEYKRRYREKHRDKVQARGRQYRQEHHNELLAYQRKYRQEHSGKHLEQVLQWQRDNPEKVAARQRRRRARKLGAEGSFTTEEWHELCDSFDWRCAACGVPHEIAPLTMDHIVPLSRDGTDWIENIQPLCRSCNSRKGTKTIDYR